MSLNTEMGSRKGGVEACGETIGMPKTQKKGGMFGIKKYCFIFAAVIDVLFYYARNSQNFNSRCSCLYKT
jgi:hypothetical protein